MHDGTSHVPNVPRPTSTTPSDSSNAKPLTADTFTGMLDTSDARVAHNYQWAPVAAHAGPTNAAGQGRLYKSRLEAQLALNARSAEEGHGGKAWNEKRRRAIERGEDPNSELLDAIARRRPDSYLERGWRWITGKKATKHEEALAQEEKERRKREAEEQQTLQGVEVSGFEPEEVKGGRKMKEKDDGVIR